MKSAEIREFIRVTQPMLDEPEAFLPAINQYVTKEEDWGEDKTRMCFILPVPQSASIQNLGIAILSNICNEQMGKDFMSTRAYHPEPKLLKRMQKESIPFFDYCIYHEMKEYDLIGFSSFYSLQFLSIIPLLNLSNIPYKAEDRLNDWNYPVVGFGGIMSYSADSLSPLFDVFFIGEGEEMMPAFLRLLRKYKKEGKSKKEFLFEAARTIQGILLPWAYEMDFYSKSDLKSNQIKEIRLTKEAQAENYPSKILKACIEFRDTPPLTKLFVPSGEGAEMSVSSLYLCNSCSNGCSFCQGSAISLPLRERPLESAKKAADELINNVGAKEIVPYCFNVSDLSYVNRLSKYILTEKNKKVSYSSERLDSMNDDFIKTAVKSGTRSFTVAIEGASPRSRKILNKHLTEEQILTAFELMFKNGAMKIKIYNIASWPFETEEDRLYYVNLMTKIEALKAKYNAKTQMRLSFTPFQSKPHTILQWAKMENVEVDENDIPVFLKTFNAMMIETKKVTTARFRFGTGSEVSLVAQALAFGDRRLFPVIEACASNPEIKYFGGMGFGGKGATPEFTRMLHTLTNLTWGYFAREKDEDEIFPWEMISTGVDKSWLLKYYKKAKETVKEPIDVEGDLHVPCYKNCSVCGVCRSFERDIKNLWPEEIYGVGRKLPKFEWPNRELDDIDVSEALDAYTKPQKLRVVRLEVDINPKFRYVDPSKMKYRLRRACFRAGIPIRNDIFAASLCILEKSWFSGKELYELYIADKKFTMSETELVSKINSEFSDDAMLVTRAEWYTGEVSSLKENFQYVLYSLTLNKEDFDISSVRSQITLINKESFFPVKVKVKSKEKRDVVRVEILNAKDYLYKVFVRDNEDTTFTLFAALSENVAMYDFSASLLNTSKRNIYKYPAIVEDFLLRSDKNSLDMWGDCCSECQGEIEFNIWGDNVSSEYCVEHKFMNEFKHRDIKVDSGFSDIIDDETEDVILGGHDDDDEDEDDTDLESKTKGSSGI